MHDLRAQGRCRTAVDDNRFRSLVALYKASADYKKLADSTRRQWNPWLDRIAEHFGELRIVQFDRHEKIRPFIRQWRAKYADKPRTADYGMQVLSRLCSFAVDPLGKLAANPCEGIKTLYSNVRAEIIWTDDDIAKVDEALNLNGQIEHDDWTSKAVALMAETTADEVPAGEDEEAAAEEASAEAKPAKTAKAKDAKAAKKGKK